MQAPQQYENGDNGLGTLRTLPLELRWDVFKAVIPPEFRQVYLVLNVGIILSHARSSPKPILLGLSKQIRDETIRATTTNTTRRIWISLTTITTDFICDRTLSPGALPILDMRNIASCRFLEITIIRPSPRTAHGFFHLRALIHDLAEAFNASAVAVLPCITVQIEDSHPGPTIPAGYNDFALLMGPLSRLTKTPRTLSLSRGPHPTPRIDAQCALLERGILGSSTAKSTLLYQQSTLEIKIPALLSHDRASYDALNARVRAACAALRGWYAAAATPPPAWLRRVYVVTGETGDLGPGLRGEVREGRDALVCVCWVSGHFKAWNPFWEESLLG